MKRNVYGKLISKEKSLDGKYVPNSLEYGIDDNGTIRRKLDKKQLRKYLKIKAREEKAKLKAQAVTDGKETI